MSIYILQRALDVPDYDERKVSRYYGLPKFHRNLLKAIARDSNQ